MSMDLSAWFDLTGKAKGDVAKEIGVGASYLSKLIKREHEPRISTGLKIVKATGGMVGLTDLVKRDD